MGFSFNAGPAPMESSVRIATHLPNSSELGVAKPNSDVEEYCGAGRKPDDGEERNPMCWEVCSNSVGLSGLARQMFAQPVRDNVLVSPYIPSFSITHTLDLLTHTSRERAVDGETTKEGRLEARTHSGRSCKVHQSISDSESVCSMDP